MRISAARLVLGFAACQCSDDRTTEMDGVTPILHSFEVVWECAASLE